MISDDLLIVKHLSPYHEVITVNPDAKVMAYSDIEKEVSMITDIFRSEKTELSKDVRGS